MEVPGIEKLIEVTANGIGSVLAGEVERPGNTSLRTLGILRDLDQATAKLFVQFCSCCVFAIRDDGRLHDGRVASFGRNAAHNALAGFGLGFIALNRLHEHGLVIADYTSWAGYDWAVIPSLDTEPLPSFQHQGREWALLSTPKYSPDGPLKVDGVALSAAGQELTGVVECKSNPKYLEHLKQFFRERNLKMYDVTDLL